MRVEDSRFRFGRSRVEALNREQLGAGCQRKPARGREVASDIPRPFGKNLRSTECHFIVRMNLSKRNLREGDRDDISPDFSILKQQVMGQRFEGV